MKSINMTPNIKVIVEKLLSGTEIPYNDVDKLNEKERELLSNIAQKAGIDDRLKIPTPKLTMEQADINRFILRFTGRISSWKRCQRTNKRAEGTTC